MSVVVDEHPILFTAEMVRAILDGRKTQTRRIVKDKNFKSGPGANLSDWHRCKEVLEIKGEDGIEFATLIHGYSVISGRLVCPYGKPGDQLWVRETWGVAHGYDSVSPRDLRPNFMKVNYEGQLEGIKKRPSIHMPRWASRIQLEIVSVRVERLNDISSHDAESEGIGHDLQQKYGDCRIGNETQNQACYRLLWESINGKGSWSANPWVWVIEFKVVQP